MYCTIYGTYACVLYGFVRKYCLTITTRFRIIQDNCVSLADLILTRVDCTAQKQMSKQRVCLVSKIGVRDAESTISVLGSGVVNGM